MFDKYRRTFVAGAVTMTLGPSVLRMMVVDFKPAPPVGQPGMVIVDPYGNVSLTALVDLDSHVISDVKVTIHGKGEKGVEISCPMGQEPLKTYDGVPILGPYQEFANKVTVEQRENGKVMKDDYVVRTSVIANSYMDNRSISGLQQTEVIKVTPGFKGRPYLVNTHTFAVQGSDLHRHGEKDKNADILDTGPATGALPLDTAPFTFIVNTEGEYRWWLDQDTFYDGRNRDIDRCGYLIGICEMPCNISIAVQGRHWYGFDVMGQVPEDHKLPRGFADATHESIETPNGTVLLCADRSNYRRDDGIHIAAIRDHVLEIDKSNRVVDIWDLTEVLDPKRDTLLGALGVGVVCASVDLTHAGRQAKPEPGTPFGDALGVGPDRNQTRVNSIAYDAKDDSIILSSCHQGVVKIGHDKQVKWILAPSKG